jgi:hypothetical protein
MKETMKVLAKILSVLYTILLIWQIFIYAKSIEIIPIELILQSLLGIVFRLIIFIPPLFYFAWSSGGKNKTFVIWGRVISLFIAIVLFSTILLSLVYRFQYATDTLGISSILANTFLMILVGYFSWFVEKQKRNNGKKQNIRIQKAKKIK